MLTTKLALGLLILLIVSLILVGCGGGSSNANLGSFTLSDSPGSVTVSQDGQGTTAIAIAPAGGFNGSVSFSASGLPSGVTATFSPNPARASSTLTLAANPTAATGTATVTIAGSSSGVPSSPATVSITVNALPAGAIKHVVIIFQENRNPDNLFHDTVLMQRGADIATQGKTSTGQMVTLTPVSLVVPYDLSHTHDAFLQACVYNPATNSCAMNGADLVGCAPNCPTNAAYQYVDNSTGDIQPYFDMAETYTFGDRMFQTNEGPSFPAHQYIISGTSRTGESNPIAVADNIGNNQRDGTAWAGCLAPPGSYANGIDITNLDPRAQLNPINYPLCFEHPTLTDLLDTAGLSWRYYAPMAGSIWVSPDAIQHMCQPTSADGKFDDTVCSGPDWTDPNPKVVIEGSNAQILTDIGAGNLPTVSWVIPTSINSDHAGNKTDNGPSWVSSIVNAVGESPYWKDTVVFVTWDDWGGWFDHAPPPSIRDSYEYGFRVPIIAISPYSKAATVSHQPNDFGSILRFIEQMFSLQQIDPTVGYADSYSLGDMSDFFNFNQIPLTFTPIKSPLGAEHFLNDKTPPSPPDND
jgi:phospholipase C